MSAGSLISTDSYGPYTRYLDVYGIKLLVLPEVSSEFPGKVAQIFESILASTTNTNSGLRTSLLNEIQANQVGQRVGFSGPKYYESIGSPEKWHQYSGPINLVDFIWETEGSPSEVIAEILEHQLHTLHNLVFSSLYPVQWNYADPESKINLAMEEAVSGGYYNTDGMYDGLENPELNTILLQEFAFWFTVTAWDYIEDYFPDKEPEWTLKKPIELQENLPITYQLYTETVEPVLSKPDKILLDSLVFSTSSTTTNELGDGSSDDSSETLSSDTVLFVSSLENETFLGSDLKTKMVVSENKADFSIERISDGSSWQISGSNIGTDTVIGFKRLEFSDGTLALDIDPGDTAGQAYRLYQAAFARTPDMPGVAYHMNDMESNGLVLWNIANNFLASPEFKSKYGENPTDEEYVNLLYQNVLGRSADPVDEVGWYKEQFDTGAMDWAAALIGFAESPENVLLVAPQIEGGIWMPF